ncbi:MAG: hypothetical protein ACNA8W_03980, partial [Bradymonadaceae bacterium]
MATIPYFATRRIVGVLCSLVFVFGASLHSADVQAQTTCTDDGDCIGLVATFSWPCCSGANLCTCYDDGTTCEPVLTPIERNTCVAVVESSCSPCGVPPCEAWGACTSDDCSTSGTRSRTCYIGGCVEGYDENGAGCLVVPFEDTEGCTASPLDGDFCDGGTGTCLGGVCEPGATCDAIACEANSQWNVGAPYVCCQDADTQCNGCRLDEYNEWACVGDVCTDLGITDTNMVYNNCGYCIGGCAGSTCANVSECPGS